MKEGILAKRYVDALSQATDEKNLVSVLQSIVSFSDSVTAAESAWKILDGPFLSLDKKETLVKKLAQMSETSEVSTHFLCLLARKKRLSLLPFIANQVEQLLIKLKNELYVVVDADNGFSSADEVVLTKLIEKDTNKKVKLNIVRSEKSLGGFKATVGHVVYDGTVENSMDTLKLSFN